MAKKKKKTDDVLPWETMYGDNTPERKLPPSKAKFYDDDYDEINERLDSAISEANRKKIKKLKKEGKLTGKEQQLPIPRRKWTPAELNALSRSFETQKKVITEKPKKKRGRKPKTLSTYVDAFIEHFGDVGGNVERVIVKPRGSDDFYEFKTVEYEGNGRYKRMAEDVLEAINDAGGGMGNVDLIFVKKDKAKRKPLEGRINGLKEYLHYAMSSSGRKVGVKLKDTEVVSKFSGKASDILKQNLKTITTDVLQKFRDDPRFKRDLAEKAILIDKSWAEKELLKHNGDLDAFGEEVINRLGKGVNKISFKSKDKDNKRWTKLATYVASKSPSWQSHIVDYAKKANLERRIIPVAEKGASVEGVIASVRSKLAKKNVSSLTKVKSVKKIVDALARHNPQLAKPEVFEAWRQTPGNVEKTIPEMLVTLYNGGEMSKKDVETAAKYFNIPVPVREIEAHEKIKQLSGTLDKKTTISAKKALAEVVYGRPDAYHQFLTKKLFPYIQDDEFRKKAKEFTRRGDYDSLREYIKKRLQGRTFNYSELQQILGTDKIRHDVLEKLKSAGVNVVGEPQEIDVSNIAPSRMSSFGRTGFSRSSGSGRGTAIPRKKSKSGLIFGSSELSWRSGGRTPTLREYAPRLSWTGISQSLKSKKGERKRLQKYDELEFHRVMSPEEIKLTAKAPLPVRKYKEYKAKKMLTDSAYYKKVMRKKMEKEKREEIAAAVTLKEYQKKMRAVQSPFFGAWYGLSRKTKIALALVLAVALLFLPVGLFYVAGWAIAVGIAYLFTLIVTIFMEIWGLLSQGIVSVINLIGQGVVGAFNYVGSTVAGWFGMSFTPFQFRLAESMIIQIGEGSGKPWWQWNLVPPSFMRLEHFMPTTFDTDTILAKIYPPIAGFFHTIYDPIAQRYVAWISTAEWYYVGAVIGIPLLVLIAGVVLFVRYLGKKWRGM